jgi:hypothetical protein
MFLGGLPDNPHWYKFLKTCDNSVRIIVHPQYLDGKTEDLIKKNDIYKKLYNNGQLLIVTESYHVRTQWATFSLISAVLLMMQYMLVNFGNIFKKFVLLDSSSYPLYKYDVMYNELVSDNKSWFYFSNENNGYARKMFKKIYDYEGGIFSMNDIVYISQWCTIDQTHIPFYFDMELIKNKQNTYIKFKLDMNCDTDAIKSVSPNNIFQKYIDSHVGTWNNKMSKIELEGILNSGLCITGDETFFGAVLKYNVKDKILDHVRHYKISDLEERSNLEFINSENDENNNYICVYENNSVHNKTTNKFRIWYGNSPGFNLNNLKYRISLIENKDSKDDSDKYFIIKDNKVITLSKQQITELESGKLKYEQLGGSYHYDKDENNNYLNIIDKESDKREIYNNIYTVSTTYTDWSVVNVNPSNMFRDFKSELFHPNKVSYFEDSVINNINNKDPYVLINDLLNKNPIVEKTYNDFVKGPSYHPAEYTLYSLSEIINSYNIIVFFNINNEENGAWFVNDYKSAKEIYENIINKYDSYLEKIEKNNKVFYYFKKENVSDEIKNKLFGYSITSTILNNALHYGALFIRKIMTKSNIELYTSQLLKLDNYVPKNMTNKIIRNNINSDDLVFKQIINKTSCKFDEINKDKIICDNNNNSIIDVNIDINNNVGLKELDTNTINCVYRKYENIELQNHLLIYFSSKTEKLLSLNRMLKFKGNFLMFCDRNDNWYEYIDNILSYCKNHIKIINATKVTIVGQSMGGYAALYISTFINKCICFTFCPQTYNFFKEGWTQMPKHVKDIKERLKNLSNNSIRYIFTGRNDRDILYSHYLKNTYNTNILSIDFKFNPIDYNNEHQLFQVIQTDVFYNIIYSNFENILNKTNLENTIYKIGFKYPQSYGTNNTIFYGINDFESKTSKSEKYKSIQNHLNLDRIKEMIHPVNNSKDDRMKNKYLKYKQKYLSLKQLN